VGRPVESLPWAQERVLRKAFREAKSHRKIAAELGLPLGTVRSHIRLALAHLRATFLAPICVDGPARFETACLEERRGTNYWTKVQLRPILVAVIDAINASTDRRVVRIVSSGSSAVRTLRMDGHGTGHRRDMFGDAWLRQSRRAQGETMSKTKTLKFGLAGVVALLSLSACVSPDEVSSLDSRVGALESRLSSAEARASQLEAAANQCTATCQDVETRAQRMYQQSMTK
jgi:hypothetical protein